MINRWKVLPHRIPTGLRAGQCRDCGQHDPTAAPETCPRCALERYSDLGYDTIVNPVVAFEDQGREQWRVIAQQLRAGRLRSGSFYIFVGYGDGGPLERPVDELADVTREWSCADMAHETALDLVRRYPQVWVVTTVGAWNVTTDPGALA